MFEVIVIGVRDCWCETREEAEQERDRILAQRRRCPNCTHIPACQFEPEWDPADVIIKERS